MIAIGARVKATHKPEHDREYCDAMIRTARARQSGNFGIVLTEKRGHGVCYEVQFATGRAWYEPDELTPEPAETPVDRCGEELGRLQGDAWFAKRVAVAAAEAFANLNGDFDATADAYRRVVETRQNLALAEARLAGARQLAEALGLVAKVTP